MGRPRTDLQPRIVEAARTRFLHDGVDGASLRQIASDAGTSVGMIHYYFETKDDLFLAVVEDVYGRLIDDLGVALASGGGVRQRLRRVFQRLGASSHKEIDVLRLVIREALVSSARLGRLLGRFRAGHLPLIFSALADGVSDGDIDGEVPLPVIMMCVAGMAMVPQVIRRGTGETPPFTGLPRERALADITLDLLFRGIAARPREAGDQRVRRRRGRPRAERSRVKRKA
jgi:AcrR family transcriptional regulator